MVYSARVGIELRVTTLWAELSTWRPPAAEVMVRPEYWAVHGATRIGKALTQADRIPDDLLDASCLEAGVMRARAVMELLTRANQAPVMWKEAYPPAVTTHAGVVSAVAGERIAEVEPAAVELLASIAHALQAGAHLAADASFDDVLAAVDAPTRTAPRPSVAFSALLVMSIDTLWAPVEMRSTWDSPSCVVASSLELASDLA